MALPSFKASLPSLYCKGPSTSLQHSHCSDAVELIAWHEQRHQLTAQKHVEHIAWHKQRHQLTAQKHVEHIAWHKKLHELTLEAKQAQSHRCYDAIRLQLQKGIDSEHAFSLPKSRLLPTGHCRKAGRMLCMEA